MLCVGWKDFNSLGGLTGFGGGFVSDKIGLFFGRELTREKKAYRGAKAVFLKVWLRARRETQIPFGNDNKNKDSSGST